MRKVSKGEIMVNIFSEQYLSDTNDGELVASAQQGDWAALEELILRHQAWIYNIALRMVCNPQDAEDVTQEILIKMMTKLSTFQGKSSFRTWLYRIVTNHVINMKRRKWEYLFSSFERYGSVIDDLPYKDPPDAQSVPVEVDLLIEETKIGCMMGMLLCLDRTQRLVFILGEVFGVSSDVGGEIMEISPENFRQKLSRARKQLRNFMDERCGLMNKENPCSCARKTRAAIEAGYVDPHHLRFYTNYVQRVKAVVLERAHRVDQALDLRAQNLFQDHPFQESPNYVRILKRMLDRKEFQEVLNFN
jgi:RNA polymerase sigma factor (sigma-70 family)